jgi:hypothetical protein
MSGFYLNSFKHAWRMNGPPRFSEVRKTPNFGAYFLLSISPSEFGQLSADKGRYCVLMLTRTKLGAGTNGKYDSWVNRGDRYKDQPKNRFLRP